jgi:tetratricopeptide (TPR) repeat protein
MFSPGYGSQGGQTALDPMFMQAGREWKSAMAQVVRKHREEGDSIFAVPYATQYTEASGNGKNLTPQPLIEWQTTSLLNSLGYPAELFNCTLNYEQVPTALRLFERAQHFIPHNLEKYLRWVNKKVCSFLKIQEYQVSLSKPRIADDMEKNNILIQLVQAGEVPREYLFKELGLENAIEIYKKRLREDTDQEFARTEQQRELEQKANGPGGAAQGGAGSGESGTGTPLDNQKRAMEKAEQWAQMDEQSRRSDMEAVTASDPSLAALAQKFLEQIRTKAEGDGRNQVVNPQ